MADDNVLSIRGGEYHLDASRIDKVEAWTVDKMYDERVWLVISQSNFPDKWGVLSDSPEFPQVRSYLEDRLTTFDSKALDRHLQDPMTPDVSTLFEAER